jgi:hypothetical protein
MIIGDMHHLIAESYTTAAVGAYRVFVPTDAQLKLLEKIGRDVLVCFPPMPGACILMSAMYAAGLQRELPDVPIHVAAGALSIGQTRVFGDDSVKDWHSVMAKSNPSWEGHSWVVFGEYIADVSIFRTAYSKYSPPLLAQHVIERFGTGRGLMIAKTSTLRGDGFVYTPEYVLREGEITSLFRGALSVIENCNSKAAP